MLEAQSLLGLRSEGCKVIKVADVQGCRVPEGTGRSLEFSSCPGVLFEKVGKAVMRLIKPRLAGAGTHSRQWSTCAVERDCCVVQCLLQPIIRRLIPLQVGQVARCSRLKKRKR